MFRRVLNAVVVGLALAALATLGACGAKTPTAADAPVAVASGMPTAPSPSPIVRLTIAAYNDSGDLVDSWPRAAVVNIEAVPVCAVASLAELRVVAPKRAALRRLLGDECKPPAYVDWDRSGASCELRGDRNAPSIRVQCTTAGELRLDAVARASAVGPEIARGSGQFRVLP